MSFDDTLKTFATFMASAEVGEIAYDAGQIRSMGPWANLQTTTRVTQVYVYCPTQTCYS